MKKTIVMAALAVLLPAQTMALNALGVGQSNLAGRGPFVEGDELPIRGAFILNRNRFLTAKSPLNQYSTIKKEDVFQKVSFLDEFFRLLVDDGHTVYAVVQGRGGSDIECWSRGGFCYDETVALVNRNKFRPDVIVMHQGESDRYDDRYHVKVSRTIQHLREDLGVPDCPVIIGEIAPYDSAAVAHNRRLQKVPDIVDNVAVVDSAGLTTVGPWHFDNWSCRELGRRYYEEFLRIY